jgi:pimeloyl-ACP methyl ester carboxylesterase
LKQSAKNETSDTKDIQVNNGGPGASAVEYIMRAGATLASKLGPDYNLIGVDPRGVNNSGSDINCFPGNDEGKALFELTYKYITDGKDPRSRARHFQLAGAFGEWCSEVHGEGGKGQGRYANTPAVAADLLNFAEKQNVAHGRPKEVAEVWFYGISYGTVLGTTFASLFPDRVGRMIVESVVDTDDYYNGDRVLSALDSDQALDHFFELCHAAGAELCPLYNSTTAEIENRASDIIESIRETPLPITNASIYPAPYLIDYALAIGFTNAMLNSQKNFPTLALGLKALESGDADGFLTIFGAMAATGINSWTTTHIGCLDALGQLDLSTMAKWDEHIQKTTEIATWTADV